MKNNNPNLPATEFAERRKQLMEMVGPDGIVIVPSASLLTRNRDAEFPFRQDSSFQYLTNFNEPSAVAVFIPEREEGEFILFCREKDPLTERWTGRMAGLEGAKADYQADDAFPIDDIDEILPGLLDRRETVHYSMGENTEFDQKVMSWVNTLKAQVRRGGHPPQEFISLDLILHDMRLYKTKAEIKLMKHAAKTSVKAHERAMTICEPGLNEGQLDAEFLHAFRWDGMVPAYTSIVGGGENACVLHYIDNNEVLNDGDLVLIDAGAEYHCYASDITRTFPVNGKFSEPQRQIYQLVLDSQYASIEASQPGNTWDAPHSAAVEVISKGLIELGLLEGDLESVIESGAYREFFMHKTGHWLGLDVHDVGDYKIDDEWRVLEAGMVLTVEPGIYISPSDTVDKKWWNIGVRIEDDVVITRKGNEVLTGALIKEVADIEALMAKGQAARGG
ncbi:aminopeptidase P N-terminal domain-containing protein [Leucothrix arctica]|uniref:Xaa-Pro aminopeptidase n=1 Tax=Leucothrix arctica TaxID=1481894 RepID=A0A317C7F8_9GAMM|nr:aminopeptidase P N-terminal domain-containing protein [Leucothrix arctica]PWQ94565.1 Xaa-Pro aminopeptidase [Leucothrix arctica]